MTRSPPVWGTSESHVVATTATAATRGSATIPRLLAIFVSVPIWSPRSAIATPSTSGAISTIARWRNAVRSGAPVVILLPAGGLIHSLNHGRLVEQDDPRLAVLCISCVVKVAEVDIGDALVRFVHHANADVTVFLVLP